MHIQIDGEVVTSKILYYSQSMKILGNIVCLHLFLHKFHFIVISPVL